MSALIGRGEQKPQQTWRGIAREGRAYGSPSGVRMRHRPHFSSHMRVSAARVRHVMCRLHHTVPLHTAPKALYTLTLWQDEEKFIAFCRNEGVRPGLMWQMTMRV